MNPTKMRDTYGKMMWILMDTEADAVKRELGLNFVKVWLLESCFDYTPCITICAVPQELLTVHSFLEARGGLKLLADPALQAATASVTRAGDSGAKAEAVARLSAQHRSQTLSEADILRVLDSISGEPCDPSDVDAYSFPPDPPSHQITMPTSHTMCCLWSA
jgi:Protein of unknown function (DUF2009)